MAFYVWNSLMVIWILFFNCCKFTILPFHLFLFLIILLLFNHSCLHFLPTPLPHPSQTHLPPLLPPSPLVLSMCPYSSSWKPFSPLSPPLSPLAIVRLLLTSMSLVIFCLLFSFVDYIPVKGEFIWYGICPSWWVPVCKTNYFHLYFSFSASLTYINYSA